jgi:hypothetical protein
MSSGVSKTRTGSFNSDGSIKEVRGVEFRPRVVRLFNVTSADGMEWVNGMADDSAIKQVAAGTRTIATSDGVTPRSDGFDVGADADVNASGELVRWVAHE